MMEGTTQFKKKIKKRKNERVTCGARQRFRRFSFSMFSKPSFKLHRFEFLDVIIKDLTLLKNCLFIPGIAHTKILTMNDHPRLKYFGLEFSLLFLLPLRLNDSIKWPLFNHSIKQTQSISFCYLYCGMKLSFTANTKSTPVTSSQQHCIRIMCLATHAE